MKVMDRTFRGVEIRRELIAALEALDPSTEIVEIEAGENMPITLTLVDEASDFVIIGFREETWNGESWARWS